MSEQTGDTPQPAKAEEIAFDQLIKPTRDQIKDLWNATKKPSIRKVSELAARRGWAISPKTVARWHNEGWIEPVKVPVSPAQRKITRATQALRKAANDLTDTDALKANPAIQEALKTLKKAEYKPRSLRVLLDLDKAKLKEEAERVLLATTIVMAEAVCDKASVVSLTPKEVGAFIESSQNALKAIASGNETPPQQGSDPAVPGDRAVTIIDTTAAPPNPVAESILAFKRKNLGAMQ